MVRQAPRLICDALITLANQHQLEIGMAHAKLRQGFDQDHLVLMGTPGTYVQDVTFWHLGFGEVRTIGQAEELITYAVRKNCSGRKISPIKPADVVMACS